MSELDRLSQDLPTESAPDLPMATEPEIPIEQDPWAYVINLITLAIALRDFAETGGGNALAWRRVDAEVEEIAPLPGSDVVLNLVAEMHAALDGVTISQLATEACNATIALMPEEVAANVRAKINGTGA